jgi:hypothetical protein
MGAFCLNDEDLTPRIWLNFCNPDEKVPFTVARRVCLSAEPSNHLSIQQIIPSVLLPRPQYSARRGVFNTIPRIVLHQIKDLLS